MHALLAGLTTLDVIHALDHEPDTTTKTTSTAHLMAAGGPATNAAVTIGALKTIAASFDDPTPKNPGSTTLLSAIGDGPIAAVLAADLASCGVDLLDAADRSSPASSPATRTAAISSIIEHPGGRMVASTNARIDVSAEVGTSLLDRALAEAGAPDVVLVDGHNPALAHLALSVGVAPEADPDDDPFAELDAKPSHLRVLDGGSWKDWFMPFLPLIDVAVVSADFRPPLLARAEGQGVANFLRGLGITKVVRTRGPEPVQWWWDGASGMTPVPQVEAASTLGAGDIFHGAFAWTLGMVHESGESVPADPTEIIDFASHIAAVSTTLFGTRTWREDSRIVAAVEEYVNERAPR